MSRNGIDIVTELLTEVSAGHARVKLSHAGICHSDIAAIASGTITGPAHIGHEASGVVVESRIPGLDAGTRVVAYATDAYATHVDVPHDRIVVLDPGCSTLDAALAEPVACVIGAIEMLPLADCSEIVLVGAGFMGLLAVRHLALLGHAVTVVEPIEARRAVALGAGAVRALHPDSVLSEYPSGTAIVIEATGSAGGLALAGDLVAIGGTLGILGYHQSENGMRTVPMERWNFRAMSVLSLHHRSAERMMRWIDRAQRSAAQGGIVPSEFVDAYFGLSDAALALAMTPADRAPVKAVLTFQ
ncbi:MAG: hypothetical protein BGN97_02945 [Microbacterium sp. 69-10]|nr:MAG: hypothetical protein BGN97_02945 [Microbacterium sp. 69-10]